MIFKGYELRIVLQDSRIEGLLVVFIDCDQELIIYVFQNHMGVYFRSDESHSEGINEKD